VTFNSSPIDDLLEIVWRSGGTDLLLTADSAPLIRVDGHVEPIADRVRLTGADAGRLINSCFDGPAQERLVADMELDFAFNWRDLARFRGNAFHQRHNLAMSLRLIPYKIPSPTELRLPKSVGQFVTLPQGLVLMTGPTGAGKSTTQASMIDWINANRQVHIVTIEDPIEYVHRHQRSAVNQREVGQDTPSFERALRSALREDPDVLLVGEMRDPESIQTTLTIAETGHLVFATLHTNDTATALDRIVDVFPTERQAQIRVQLAASLMGVLSQRLVPRIGGGLVAAFEVLVVNNAVRNLIRIGKTEQIRNVIATGQREGMQTLEMALTQLVAEGLVTLEDAWSRSVHPKEIKAPPLSSVPRPGSSPSRDMAAVPGA
jgi:twitching motility protein PilT